VALFHPQAFYLNGMLTFEALDTQSAQASLRAAQAVSILQAGQFS
jgi:hypothetical protein